MLEQKVIGPEARTRITKVVQCIRSLESWFVMLVTCRRQWKQISPEAIMTLYNSI